MSQDIIDSIISAYPGIDKIRMAYNTMSIADFYPYNLPYPDFDHSQLIERLVLRIPLDFVPIVDRSKLKLVKHGDEMGFIMAFLQNKVGCVLSSGDIFMASDMNRFLIKRIEGARITIIDSSHTDYSGYLINLCNLDMEV